MIFQRNLWRSQTCYREGGDTLGFVFPEASARQVSDKSRGAPQRQMPIVDRNETYSEKRKNHAGLWMLEMFELLARGENSAAAAGRGRRSEDRRRKHSTRGTNAEWAIEQHRSAARRYGSCSRMSI